MNRPIGITFRHSRSCTLCTVGTSHQSQEERPHKMWEYAEPIELKLVPDRKQLYGDFFRLRFGRQWTFVVEYKLAVYVIQGTPKSTQHLLIKKSFGVLYLISFCGSFSGKLSSPKLDASFQRTVWWTKMVESGTN